MTRGSTIGLVFTVLTLATIAYALAKYHDWAEALGGASAVIAVGIVVNSIWGD